MLIGPSRGFVCLFVCVCVLDERVCVCAWLQGCGVDEAVRKRTGAPLFTLSAVLQRLSCPRGRALMEATES